MKFEDLVKLYLEKEKIWGANTHQHISEILREAKELHKLDWQKKPTKNGDHEQSWRAFKGKNLEKLIEYIIKNEVEDLGLKIINGNRLERSSNTSDDELTQVKRNLEVDYGEFERHLPNVDLVIYNPQNQKVLMVISIKVTLRERIAQTGYWKLKFLQNKTTRHIKVCFVTLDEDGTLTSQEPVKKGRAIVEVDLDSSYVLTDETIGESPKVKYFSAFIEDLKIIAENN